MCAYRRSIFTPTRSIAIEFLTVSRRNLDRSLPLFNYRSKPLFPLNVIIEWRAVTLKSVLDDRNARQYTPMYSREGYAAARVSLSAVRMCRKHFAETLRLMLWKKPFVIESSSSLYLSI